MGNLFSCIENLNYVNVNENENEYQPPLISQQFGNVDSCPECVKKIYVILTVPHAIKSIGWDKLALKAAQILFNNIKTYSSHLEPVLFIPEIGRKQCDLNRYKYCNLNSEYYKRIGDFIKLRETEILFGLDIHSFDKLEGYFDGSEIAFIDDDLSYYYRKKSELSIRLNDYFNRIGINSNIYRGKSNFMHSRLRNFGLKTTLIEFEEHLSMKRLDFICKQVVYVLNKYLV